MCIRDRSTWGNHSDTATRKSSSSSKMEIPYSTFITTTNPCERPKERNIVAVILLMLFTLIPLGFYTVVESIFIFDAIQNFAIGLFDLTLILVFGVFLYGNILYLLALGKGESLSASLLFVGLGGIGSVGVWYGIALGLLDSDLGWLGELFAQLSVALGGFTAFTTGFLLIIGCLIRNPNTDSLSIQYTQQTRDRSPLTVAMVTLLLAFSLGFHGLIELDILADCLVEQSFDFYSITTLSIFGAYILGQIAYLYGFLNNDDDTFEKSIWVIGLGGASTTVLWVAVATGFISFEFDLMMAILEVFSLPLAIFTVALTILLIVIGKNVNANASTVRVPEAFRGRAQFMHIQFEFHTAES
eukprot:TRINITY_DN3853_c0_g1_i2.p1 TRINITY_DN3853_c0_g1~~TRINITY_DN3853_c0_g1_i2.p1  ORF type:complete len:373 (-),score=64.57 TRINITY_DN3853_c0_g1_i2:224-1294(-)